MSVTGPGTRLLRHGEQRVGDIGQKAVQVKHVGLHRRGLGFWVHLIGPLLQLGLADLTLEITKHTAGKPSKTNSEQRVKSLNKGARASAFAERL